MKTNCGVYKITNLIPNETTGLCKVYVGSSENLKSRKYQHFNSLKLNKHTNKHLQSSFNRDKEENFKWEVIKYIEKIEDKKELREVLIKEEQKEINIYKNEYGNIDRDKCYNFNPTAGSSLGSKHKTRKFNPLTIKRDYRIINLDTNEIFSSMTEASKKLNIHVNSICNVCKGKSKTAGGFKWGYVDEKKKDDSKPYTEKIREKKVSCKNQKHKKKVINLTTHTQFYSMEEAAKHYNLNPIGIGRACKGKRKTCGGYEWSFVNQ